MQQIFEKKEVPTVKLPLRLLVTFMCLFAVVFIAMQGIPQAIAAKTERETCKSLGNQDAARKDYVLFLSYPQVYPQYKNLDADHDGIPCEHLPKHATQ